MIRVSLKKLTCQSTPAVSSKVGFSPAWEQQRNSTLILFIGGPMNVHEIFFFPSDGSEDVDGQ